MEQIAWIVGHIYIYWSAVVKLLAAAAGIFGFLALYLEDGKKPLASVLAVPMAVGLSLALGRLAHWYFRPDSYESFSAAMNLLSPGGFALMGAFAGCFLTALLLHVMKLTEDLPKLLDCMSLAGCLSIALGRLSSFFNTTDRGLLLKSQWALPFADTIINPISGQGECRLATFLLQAVVAAVIFAGLLAFYRKGKHRHSGDVCLLFLLLHGSAQVVLDSTRYDSLSFRSNGFVSVVQVLGACAIVLAVVFFSIRLVRAGGFRKQDLALWLLQAVCLGLAGYMEYHVQRHGEEAALAYSTMSLALAGNLILTMLIRLLTPIRQTQRRRMENKNALYGSWDQQIPADSPTPSITE